MSLPEDNDFPIIYKRHAQARYYRIVVQKDGSVKVTIPARGNREEAQKFVAQQKNWIEKNRLRQQTSARSPREWKPGVSILWRGEWHIIVDASLPQKNAITLNGEYFRVPAIDVNLRPALEAAFLRKAKIELPARAWALAAKTASSLKTISIRSQRTRWGSCSSSGRISLNWKLMQTPDFVVDYVICHELAHLKHMNHSVRFWQEVDRIFPLRNEAELWLKKHAAYLDL